MLRSRLLIGLTATTLLVPSLALAQDDPTPSVSPRVESAHFCGRFTEATADLSTGTTSRFKQLQDNVVQHDTKLKDDFASLKTKQTSGRQTADHNLQDRLAKLDAQATTTAQKTAIADFKTAILAAVTTRRAAFDTAGTTFHTGLAAVLSARQTALKTAATTYRAAVASALAAAKASCLAGTSPATVRTTLRAALKTAQTNLQTTRASMDKLGPDVRTLTAAHRAAIAKANADFKTTVQTALAKLKAALAHS